MGRNALSSVSPVVHEEEINVLGVVNEESLVAGGHHVLGLLVAAVTDLSNVLAFAHCHYIPNDSTRYDSKFDVDQAGSWTYGGHGDVRLEASADTVVDTLRLAP